MSVYVAPGVRLEEGPSPLFGGILSDRRIVGIVGETKGTRPFVEEVNPSDTDRIKRLRYLEVKVC